MLHSRKLRYIDEIARCGSIRKAAARLNVASSAVNRQIIALEEEIGAPIFERLPRGLRLTAAGELYVEHIREVLKAYGKLEARLRGLKTPQAGKVTLVTTVGLAAGPLAGILSRFVDEHPRIHVRLRNDGPATVPAALQSGEVDIGLGFNLPATPGLRTMASFELPLGAVVAARHPLARQKTAKLADLMGAPLVLAQSGSSLRDMIDLALAPLGLPIEPLVETNSMEMLKKLVRNGTGISFMNPLDILTDMQEGDLAFLPLSDTHVRNQPLKLVSRVTSALDTATSQFVEYLLARLNETIEELSAAGWQIRPVPEPAGLQPV
ncbi:LysR family transcriptional regulator [Chelativorans sp. ZYF759]|uniref:LysR family transcriptional regulator n=1 Tax=Chelativorans sp. ZYF759 TaxID=2692213 RepID=UPI00145D68EE|nr:LysR family transcriptional regulator [Chelativorans sp. ZYF759]NMG41557.1 LysR family transcriptional regulator [Chelativorans sp. ZYF759]